MKIDYIPHRNEKINSNVIATLIATGDPNGKFFTMVREVYKGN